MKTFKELAKGFINEELMLKDTGIAKIAKIVGKEYNLGKPINTEFTSDPKSPTLMIEFEKLTVVFMKSFEWGDSVDMGVWKQKEYVKSKRTMDALAKSDVIHYDPFSRYVADANTRGDKTLNVLKEEVAQVVRPLFGLKNEVMKKED